METVTIEAAVEQAAQAALANIPIADPLTMGTAVSTASAVSDFAGVAVSARFTGSRSGEILIAVEQSVADALQNSPLGALDITAALAPALSAAANTVSIVVLGPGQALLPSPALDSLLSKPNSAVIPLMHAGVVRALVGLAVTLDEPEAAGPSAPSYPTREELVRSRNEASGGLADRAANRNGLDMLRDVAMDVTAQIGSTRMTVSELLNLADGAVIELDRTAGSPADLLVNGHLVARGEVVVIDENFGLRITEIVTDDTMAAVRP